MIRIVTDSAADLTAAELSAPGVFVVPLSVTFADGTTQLDDGTMTKDEFFVRLAEDSKLPRTSQPSPASFMQVYEEAAAAGDEVLVITIAQKLSGTYQCAHLAAADVGLQAHIVDSEAASQGEALLVREAVRLRDEEGLTAEEIAAVLEQFKKRVRIVAVVDSLKHLQKGGRLPAAVALVGGGAGWYFKVYRPCRTALSSWWTRAAAVPVRWLRCSSSWTRSAVLTRATAIRCSTAITSSLLHRYTTTCTRISN